MKRPEESDEEERTGPLCSQSIKAGPLKKKRKKYVSSSTATSSTGTTNNTDQNGSTSASNSNSSHGGGYSQGSDDSSIEKEYAAAMAMTAAANSTMDRNDPSTTSRMSPTIDHSNNSKKPSGIILKGGRVRLPDKLMEYLNKEVAPEVLYWQTGGESFSFDSKTAQTELLDKYFNGTKLSSFTRSLNRWGFKRIFHALLPKHVLSYEHPCFKKSNPDLVKDMKMADAHEETHGNNNNQTNSNGNASGAGKSKKSQGQEDHPSCQQSSQRSASDRAAAAALQGNPTGILSSTAVNGVLPQVASFSQVPNGPAVALILNGLSNAGAGGVGAAAVAGISPALLQSIAAAHAQAAAAQAAAVVSATNVASASNVTSPALTSQNVAAASAAAPGAGSCFGDVIRSLVTAQHPATTNPSAPTATATVSPEMAQRLAIQALNASHQQRTVQQTLSFGQQVQQQQQGQDQQPRRQQQVDIQRLLLSAFLNPPQPQSLPLTTLKSLFCQSSGIGGANCQIQPQLEILAAQAQQASASSAAIQQALQHAGDAQNQQRQAALQLLLSLLAQQQQNEGSHQQQQQNNNSNNQNSN